MEDLSMMKDVTILTFDEMERIRDDIDNMIDNAKDGAYEKFNPKDVCNWLMEDLKKFREQFE
jgi:hypothetical protein